MPFCAGHAQVREVGDGNINFVYITEGPAGGLVLKQGLPYIRIARDWALTQVRTLRPSSPPPAADLGRVMAPGCGSRICTVVHKLQAKPS